MFAVRLSSAIAALTLGTAVAATAGGYIAPIVEPVVPAPVVEPVGNWQGGYAGLTLGYAFTGEDRVGLTDATSGDYLGDIGDIKLKGVNATIRAGYRWQRDRWVFGPELGYEAGDFKGDTNGVIGGTSYEAESKLKNVIALRMKTGYEVSPGTLVYGIAGVARADVEYKLTGASGPDTLTDDYKKTGYILGLGVERQINDKWSVTGEYEYANFGKEKLQFGDLTTESTPKYNNIKLGVNFKF